MLRRSVPVLCGLAVVLTATLLLLLAMLGPADRPGSAAAPVAMNVIEPDPATEAEIASAHSAVLDPASEVEMLSATDELNFESLEPTPLLPDDELRRVEAQIELARREIGVENFAPYDVTPSDVEPAEPVLHAEGRASKSLRNSDFPNTYISAIDIDLTSPQHSVRLTWTGPLAAEQETGPFHSSPGAGLGNNDCDDEDESRRENSNCTPKGTRAVEAFSDYMVSYPTARWVTWFDAKRGIALHSYSNVPNYPASHGCVRLHSNAAQLIHNNSLIGKTMVTVDGTWSRNGR